MLWVDRELQKIKERNLPLEWVDDMKTPSGRIHVGALRGVVIHDIMYKTLVENGMNARFTYVIEDHDPMDAIPSYLDYETWEPHAGKQLYKIPSPEKGFKNYAEYFAREFIDVFESINCHPEIIWASQLYLSGKMNNLVKTVLDNAEKIREIYLRVSKTKKPDNWFPFNINCKKCDKISTTQIYKWDGEYVHYRCSADVAWANSCGHEGKRSPYDGNGKTPWRVEWPAKWKTIGVTIEGGGKDHMSAGGSYEMASVFCREIFDYPVPHPLPYEWFTIGGRKMSSSKGIGTSAKEVSKILPPDVFRFFIVRAPIGTAIDFNPYGETILNIFDDYDRCLNAYFDKLEGKIPEGKPGEVISDFARIIELSQVNSLPKKRMFIPRFRTVTNMLKTKTDLQIFFESQKGNALTPDEKATLEERMVFARIYLDTYASEEDRIRLLENPPKDLLLSDSQKAFLNIVVTKLKGIKNADRESVQNILFDAVREKAFQPKEVFKAFYQILIGKDHGPKAADLIMEFEIENIVKSIEKVL